MDRPLGAAPFGLEGCGFLGWDMRNKLVRIYGHGHMHFVTFSCYRRQALLGSVGTRSLFVAVLGEVRRRYQFRLVGFVVMPEHVHLLMSEPGKGDPSKVIQALKQTVSRRLRSKSGRKIVGIQLPLSLVGEDSYPHFWQHRFYDFNVWSDEKKIEKLEYMHQNPVKRGLVQDPKDWAWSSYGFYAGGEDGLVKIDLM